MIIESLVTKMKVFQGAPLSVNTFLICLILVAALFIVASP